MTSFFILYESDEIFQLRQDYMDLCKDIQFVHGRLSDFENQSHLKWDLNFILHVHQFCPDKREKAAKLLTHVVDCFNKE